MEFNYNAGFHVPIAPPLVAYNINVGSKLVNPFNPNGHLEPTGSTTEVELGALFDVGVSAGIGDFSGTGGKCAGSTISFGLGKYSGLQLTLRKDAKLFKPSTWIDGISFGLGRGIAFPATYTIPVHTQFIDPVP
jgi:hypothetical protein